MVMAPNAHPLVSIEFVLTSGARLIRHAYHVPRVGDRVELQVGDDVVAGVVVGVTWQTLVRGEGACVEVLTDG